MGHRNIVIFNRKVITNLQVKSDSYPEGFGGKKGEGGVVIGLAASKSCPIAGKTYSRTETEVDFAQADRGVMSWVGLVDVEGSLTQLTWVPNQMKA
jgi:hypothetical protein